MQMTNSIRCAHVNQFNGLAGWKRKQTKNVPCFLSSIDSYSYCIVLRNMLKMYTWVSTFRQPSFFILTRIVPLISDAFLFCAILLALLGLLNICINLWIHRRVQASGEIRHSYGRSNWWERSKTSRLLSHVPGDGQSQSNASYRLPLHFNWRVRLSEQERRPCGPVDDARVAWEERECSTGRLTKAHVG